MKPMDLPKAIDSLVQNQDLTGREMEDVIATIMQGNATPAQIGAFLVALRIKGETVEELTAAAKVVRRFAAKVVINSKNILDIVGTGGDGAGLFNVSTASALVAAGAGAIIAKHGNRAVTGKSGSADLLEKGGVNINVTASEVEKTVESVGIGYMFAPAHHGAFRHLVAPRREIGIRTMFNLLGPLTNPAGAKFQLVGVFHQKWVRPLTEVFKSLGSIHTVVVHSHDGLDEISIAAPTYVSELKEGHILDYQISPTDFGFNFQSIEELRVDSVDASFDLVKNALMGNHGPAYDMIALNAGAAIYASNLVTTLDAGVAKACEILDAGHGLGKLNELAAFTQSFPVD
tara:strand:+ start:8090 stop:9124 length:1035 start_codon:yes stop_codon:yes gene_type:complete